MSPKIPTISVPMNFGIHLLDSPTHSTLNLLAKDGKVVKASSVIMSFNSPVIDNLTTTLHMTSVDMQEFSEEAVRVFVNAAYSGNAEGFTRETFRDINKMANVFEMTWLIERCNLYFADLADSVQNPSFTELLFLFDEAGFVFENLKDPYLFQVAARKIGMLGWKEQFVSKYLENPARLSTKRLDMILELADTEINCVVRSLTNQLTDLIEVQGISTIPRTFQYLLENSNLGLCKKYDRVLFDQLFTTLDRLPDSAENIKWTFELYRNSDNKTNKAKTGGQKASTIATICRKTSLVHDVNKNKTKRCDVIPNLYHRLDMDMSLDELMKWISSSPKVTSLFMAIEAVWTWLIYPYGCDNNNRPDIDVSTLTTKLLRMREEKNWRLLPERFLDYSIHLYTKNRKDLYWEPFCLSSHDDSTTTFIEGASIYMKPLTDLSKELKLVFYFKHPSVVSCNLKGKCGFILKTIPTDAGLRKLMLCTDNEDYNANIHFHNEILAESMHVFLVRIVNGESLVYPMSWLRWLYSSALRSRWEESYLSMNGCRFAVLYKFN